MQVSFHIVKNKIDKKGFVPVYYTITLNGQRIRKQVKGVKCLPSHWKDKEEKIKAPYKSEAYNFHLEYNKKIEEIKTKFADLYRYIHLNGLSPSKEFIMEKIENDGWANVNFSHDFFTSFQEFIDINKTTKSERTIKGYVTNKNFLTAFEAFTGDKLHFESIDREFYEKLRDYAFEEREARNNYFFKIISVLKTFMNWAYERGYHENLAYQRFKRQEDETEVIYLTMDELMTLYNHDFESKRLEHVRDVYCFGCFTGLRYSDIKQLRTSNIFDNHIRINVQKTRTIDHKIPLNVYSKAILDKYRDTVYEPLPVISGQKFNKYIKECCEEVEINTPTTITRYIGQKRIDKTFPKHELITSHTARKTFVTNSLILGMKEMIVRDITGHKKESSFKRYVKIADDFKQREMDSTWNKV
ncbi:site-specific integrase [Sinomicrobium weinanense]|uniref:Site-specific integrase n=1 Tax=Sinomicrobium weinanense TaxID=2842200 RepID=A0A926Q237_9FLAO|nr:site-specific integrase [Sinomicrobium weinanense]MBC9795429.1 site-specific integrase [Sinomicrobium weinanense]MBU3123954.1 site-specific integrase [Sinomicrobium weinanense]